MFLWLSKSQAALRWVITMTPSCVLLGHRGLGYPLSFLSLCLPLLLLHSSRLFCDWKSQFSSLIRSCHCKYPYLWSSHIGGNVMSTSVYVVDSPVCFPNSVRTSYLDPTAGYWLCGYFWGQSLIRAPRALLWEPLGCPNFPGLFFGNHGSLVIPLS